MAAYSATDPAVGGGPSRPRTARRVDLVGARDAWGASGGVQYAGHVTYTIYPRNETVNTHGIHVYKSSSKISTASEN